MSKNYLKLAVNIPSVIWGFARWFSIAWIENYISPVLERVSSWAGIPMIALEGFLVGVVLVGSIWWLISGLKNKTETGELKLKRIKDTDKTEVTDLMRLVNTLEDRMNRFFNEALYHKGDRVVKYQSLLDSPDFSDLWDKYSSQRATVSVISPELEERVRLLLALIRGCHKNTLKEWYVSQLPRLNREMDEQITAIENIKKGIKQTIKELIE